MTKQINWDAVERRYGDGSFTSNRQIAREYNITEAAIRKKIKEECWARDCVRARIEWIRADFKIQIDLLEQEVRARLAVTKAPLQDEPGYPPDAE